MLLIVISLSSAPNPAPSLPTRVTFPVTVELSAAQATRANEVVERLAGLGFAVEPFGGSAFAVREVPALMASADPAAILRDLAGEGEGGLEAVEALDR